MWYHCSGDPHGEMFEGRNGPMPGFRGREGMNMGAQDRPPMDTRRFDYAPDMMGRNMGLLGRGRDSPRDFFMPENELDFRRRFEMEQNSPAYRGQGRPPIDMGGRDMQVRNMRGPDMDMRERDRFRLDMPGFNMPPTDIRRRLAMESMDRNDHMRERERSQMSMNDIDGYSMDMPPRERSVDFDRRGCAPPLNPRGMFESDLDLRNRMGPSKAGDFRDRSPQMFRGSDGMNIRGRHDLPLDRQGPEKEMLKVGEPTLRDREFPEQTENRSGFRGEDGKSLSEEWCRRMNRGSNLSREVKKRFPPGHGTEGELGQPSQFKDRERPSGEIPGKDRGTLEFSRSDRDGPAVQNWDSVQTDVPGRDPSHSVSQKPPLLPLNPSLNIPNKDKEGQHWSRDEKPDSTLPSGGRHPFFPDKSSTVKDSHLSADQGNLKGKDMPLDEDQKKGNLIPGPRDPQSNREGRRDQDYGDIDYRTSSAQKYDYILEGLQAPEKNVKTSKSAPPERSNSSGSQVNFFILPIVS